MKRLAVLQFVALALWPGGHLSAESAIDPRIFAGKGPEERASFLVVLSEQADVSPAAAISDRSQRIGFVYEALRARAEVSQAALRARLAAAGVPFRPHFLVNMIEVEGSASLAGELAGRPEVALVARNAGAALPPRPRGPITQERSPAEERTVEPNISLIGAPQVWERGFTGQGIVVAMADTGFQWDHPALKSHYRGFDGSAASHDYNWHDAIHDPGPGNPCFANSPTPCDDDGHGTSTASLVVGDDGAGNQIGVAPGARFMGCRNMDRGEGTPARYTECFEFFLAPTDRNGANPRPDLAPHVINNSWGCPNSEGCTDPNILKTVVENVRAAGILVVVSAGNEGPGCSTVGVPAIYEASFAVGATTITDAIAVFSSRGTVTADGSNRLKPDISAPGVAIRVAEKVGGYSRGFSGTSASAPEVSGAAALLLSAAPELIDDPAATADLLRRTAVPLADGETCGGISGTAVPNPIFGSGRLDVFEAVAVAAPVGRVDPTQAASRERRARDLPPRP